MPDLDSIRTLYPDAPPASPAARDRARLALVEHIERRDRRRFRISRRFALAGAGLATAAAAAAIALVGVGDEARIDASAAAVLRDAAARAKAQRPLPPIVEGRVLYVRSVNAYLSTWAEAGFSVLQPTVREIWIGPDGGRISSRSAAPRFLSHRDRRRWISAGRPRLGGDPGGTVAIGPQRPSDLPADADALFARLKNDASGHSEGTYRQMFTLAADAFRETNVSPAQRAALYEVVARTPGVELVGRVTDSAGRRGVAVAMDHPDDGMRHTLVIDPETGTMLAEQQVTLGENPFGYRAGTVIGHSTYLVTRMVGAVGARPR